MERKSQKCQQEALRRNQGKETNPGAVRPTTGWQYCHEDRTEEKARDAPTRPYQGNAVETLL